jgi:hypothetical protein
VEWDLLHKENHWVRQGENGGGEIVRFLRYRNIPGYAAISNVNISAGQNPLTLDISFSIINGGAGQLESGGVAVQIYKIEDGQTTPAVNLPVLKKEFKLDHALSISESIHFSDNMRLDQAGNYHVVVLTASPEGINRELGAIDLAVP